MGVKATAWNELHLAENPAVEALQSLGYTCMAPEDIELERTSFKEPILTDRLAAALKRLNPWLSDSNVTRAVNPSLTFGVKRRTESTWNISSGTTSGVLRMTNRAVVWMGGGVRPRSCGRCAAVP